MSHRFVIGQLNRVTTTLNDRDASSPCTIGIAGVARGGTTMVASVVHALGIEMGPEYDLQNFHFEDQAMKFHGPESLEKVVERIRERNKETPVWGWKSGHLVVNSEIKSILSHLRSPRIVMVCRDPLAVAQRQFSIQEGGPHVGPVDFNFIYNVALQGYVKNKEWVQQTDLPVLLVPYERALSNIEKFVSELAEFIGATPSGIEKKEAISRVSKSGGYLQTAFN